MIKVMLIGTLPPPIGGVTIHIERLYKKNLQTGTVDLSVVDLRNKKYFKDGKTFSLLFAVTGFFSADIIHIQISNQLKLLFALLARLVLKKVVYTHHNIRVNNKFLFGLLIKLCSRIIAVNVKDLKYDLSEKELKKISEIPAFIAPSETGILPEEIEKICDENTFVICSNSTEDAYFNSKLTYGYDILIEAYLNFLKNNSSPQSILILVDPSGKLKNIVGNLIGKYSDQNSRGKIFYYDNKLDFAALIKKSSLVVRSTRTDGDALTVREALYFGKLVIASDCAERPEKTILFQNENAVDLEEKITRVYLNKDVPGSGNKDFFEPVISLYRNLN